MKPVITARQLGKRFRRHRTNHPRTLKEWILSGLNWKRPVDSHWALRGIDLSITPGRMLGVIGANGSGKSTLLQLIGGTFPPDEGSIQVKGRIGALIDLGTGFHRDLSGRENLYLYGVIAGLTRQEVRGRFDSIVSFAELEDFIDSPYRTYSTGMQMRLAFSAAIHAQPEVLLIDEVLAVGDLAFQNKCIDRILQLRADGCTMVIVSHDLDRIKGLCDEAIWIRDGRLLVSGDPESVVQEYSSLMSMETRRRTPKNTPMRQTSAGVELHSDQNRFGSLELEILDLHILNSHNLPVDSIESGDSLCIEIVYSAPEPVDSPIFGVTLSSEERNDFLDLNTDASGLRMPQVFGEGSIRLILDRLDLKAGKYYINPGIYQRNWEYVYDYHWHVYPIIIDSKTYSRGVLLPPHHWVLG